MQSHMFLYIFKLLKLPSTSSIKLSEIEYVYPGNKYQKRMSVLLAKQRLHSIYRM